MTWKTALLDCNQMARADTLAGIGGLSMYQLMENAGRAVATEIQRRWQKRPVVVLCGPGNNGGDGFVVAHVLSASGWPVRVAMIGTVAGLSQTARQHAQKWGGPIEPMSPAILDGAGLVVDAIFGAGLNRALCSQVRETLAAASALKDVPIVSIDVPSGLNGDTGQSFGAPHSLDALRANVTVTFFRKKPGHVLLPGRMLCGETVVADIGIPPTVLEQIKAMTFENDPALWLNKLNWPQADGHKYTRGHALIVGGYPMTGAARLAARSAARVGAGLTTVAVPEMAYSIYATSLISIMVHPLSSDTDFFELLAEPRLAALLIGPGASATESTRLQARAMLASGRPVVLDAGALTAFAQSPEELFSAIRAAPTRPCVLTPHEGEFSRLFAVTGDKLARCRAAAQLSHAVVVLKGSDTVIAAPDGRAIINSNAPAWLATAGSGDVLAGLITGLLAQGLTSLDATAAAVWMHGAAATEFGPGLIAEDLPDMLPIVLRKLQDAML
jgi:ADP-dependent NAD(P)H-hydrate dehydratase / NAD(P)H-hydrate epimerase